MGREEEHLSHTSGWYDKSRPFPSSIEQRRFSVIGLFFGSLSSGTYSSTTAFYASLSVAGRRGPFCVICEKRNGPSLQPRIPPLTALFGGCLLRFPRRLQASSDVTRFQG